ncbi:hypothetical protein BC829DRAFT_400357, partial [Chytridium lagenaria]
MSDDEGPPVELEDEEEDGIQNLDYTQLIGDRLVLFPHNTGNDIANLKRPASASRTSTTHSNAPSTQSVSSQVKTENSIREQPAWLYGIQTNKLVKSHSQKVATLKTMGRPKRNSVLLYPEELLLLVEKGAVLLRHAEVEKLAGAVVDDHAEDNV